MTNDRRTPSTEIVPFTLHLSAATIDDLHQRLRRTRLAEHETVTGDGEDWEQGIPLDYVRQLSHS